MKPMPPSRKNHRPKYESVSEKRLHVVRSGHGSDLSRDSPQSIHHHSKLSRHDSPYNGSDTYVTAAAYRTASELRFVECFRWKTRYIVLTRLTISLRCFAAEDRVTVRRPARGSPRELRAITAARHDPDTRRSRRTPHDTGEWSSKRCRHPTLCVPIPRECAASCCFSIWAWSS